jgi:hypothetical protein
MTTDVKRQNVIIKYLKKTDRDLYDIISDLCIGKIFIPRKSNPGITFLRPDKDQMAELKKMVKEDRTDELVESIQSLVLLDDIATIREFYDRKSDIPTYLRKKLPISSVEKTKVVLANGAEITQDKVYKQSEDSPNINVFLISKGLVPTNTEDATFENVKNNAASKNRNAAFSVQRAELFERVLSDFCKKNSGDSAMEILTAMHTWALKTDNTKLASNVASKVSYDTLTSLAIILQPYKKGQSDYITDSDLNCFIEEVYGTNVSKFKKSQHYSFKQDICKYYDNLVMDNSNTYSELYKQLRKWSNSITKKISKATAVSVLTDFYNNYATKLNEKLGQKVHPDVLYSEAELRVLSATAIENSDYDFEKPVLLRLYKSCTLDSPYMSADKKIMASSAVTFYYSTAFLIARSDALYYTPNDCKGESLQSVAEEDGTFININGSVKNMLQQKRDKSQVEINNLIETVGRY